MTPEEKAAQWDPDMLALLADVKASIDTYLHRKKRKTKISVPSGRIQDERSGRCGGVSTKPIHPTTLLPTGDGLISKQSELPAA